MRIRQILIYMSVFTAVAACENTIDKVAESTKAHTGVQTDKTIDEAVTVKEMQPPTTLEERRKLRQQLADRQTKVSGNQDRMADEPVEPANGDVPSEIFEKIINTFMAKTGANEPDIIVKRTESLTFSDGSLDCGKPGQNYTHAPVAGYRVILGYAGQQFDYRATEKGFFMLCEQPTMAAPGASSKPPVM